MTTAAIEAAKRAAVQDTHEPSPNSNGPPRSLSPVDAQKTVLSGFLNDWDSITTAQKMGVTSKHFGVTCAPIAEAAFALWDSDSPVDLLAVKNTLETTGQLDLIGGPETLEILANHRPEPLEWHEAVSILIDDYRHNQSMLLLEEHTLQIHNKDFEAARKTLEAIEALHNGGKRKLQPSTWGQMADILGPLCWAWQDWLPEGLLAMVVSESGVGKSALALRLAACYLAGAHWPDGKPFTGELGRVLWVEAEAAQAINLDRAQKWGLPVDRILAPLPDPLADVSLFDPAHKEAIEQAATAPNVGLVIVDSLSGGANDDDKPETKAAIKWLAELAKKTNRPVIVTHHLRKKGITDGDIITLDRVRGSTKVAQFCRVIWALDKPDPLADTKRLQVIKSNIGRFPDPIGLDVAQEGVTAAIAPEPPRVETQQEKAADMLLALLKSEPMWVKDLKQEFEGAAISWPTVRLAQKRLGIVKIKDGKRGWKWSLPHI